VREPQDPGSLLLLEQRERITIEIWGDDDVQLQLSHLPGSLEVDWAIQCDDPSTRGNGVALVGGPIGVRKGLAPGEPAGHRVLDDRNGRPVEKLRGIPGGVGVEVVVEGKRIALQLLRAEETRHAGAGTQPGIDRRCLVRVFAVPWGY